MASGFVSSVVTRLFPGKGKDKHAHPDGAHSSKKKLLDKPSSSPPQPPPPPSSSSSSPATATAPAVKKRERTKTSHKPDAPSPALPPPESAAKKPREPTKRKSPLFSSLRKRTRPLSCFVARPESPTETEEMLERGNEASKKTASKHGAHRGREEGEEEEEEKKTPAASQKRKEKKKPRRPLSCIVQPPSPQLPAVDRSLKNPHRSPEADSAPRGSSPRGAAPARHAKAQDRPRPVSCFVETPQHRSPPPYSRRPQQQQPSPQASVRLDEQLARGAGTPDQALLPYSPISNRSSALFGSPCRESPSLRSQTPTTPEVRRHHAESPRRDFPYYAESSQQQPTPYYADSSRQPILYYDETPQKATAYYGEIPQKATPYYGETPQQSSPYYGEISPQSSPYYGETSQQSSPYYGETPQQSSPYYGETPQQSSPYYAEAVHQQLSCYGGTPRQSTPVMGSPGSSETLEARRPNSSCPLSPYQPSTPPQAYSGGRSYDLKTYFPSAAPVRRGPRLPSRPQSACFLCEPQPCCVEGGRARRPLSQCYLPECSLPWSAPKPTRGSAAAATLQEEVLAGQSSPASPASGVEVVTLPTPTPTLPAPAVERSPIPRPRSGVSLAPEPERSSPTAEPAPTLREASPATPRAAKRTLVPLPRPKSACLLSSELESESSLAPMTSPTRGESSPAPSPPPPRFALKKYRSADCLDRVDEIESLDFSPPPAKPLSYFTDSDSQSAKTTTTTVKKRKDKHDEIYTSAEMLEKLGQPRGARISSSHPACWRPVSCFVGSADESGYLSSATLGGSGWLGGLSASTGDILEILDGDEVNAADDELSFERASSFRKAWSVCSLLRQDSIQDRSFTVMRRRRQKMKNRRQSNLRSSSTETDEGVEVKVGHSATSSLDDDREKDGEGDGEGEESSSTVAGFPLDGMPLGHAPGSRGRREVRRLHSAHMKTWQIRLRRKQMLTKRRSYERLNPRMETLV